MGSETMNHTVTLETAKRMRELGYPQGESLFYYRGDYLTNPWEENDYGIKKGERVDAPISSEIGEELPLNTSCWRQVCDSDLNEEFRCQVNNLSKTTWGETEAEARGLMWVYLAENNLLEGNNGHD